MRQPIIQVIGPSGRNLVSLWGSSLVGVSITDQAGYESDEATITIRDNPPNWTAPPKGTAYTISLGWAADAMAMTGIYTVQRVGFSGSPDEGTQMRIVCRAGDFIDKLKEVDSGHYDGKTVGEIVRDISGKMGVPAVVAAELDGIKLPYRLRHRQSAGDFLTRLADDVGGIIKPAAGRLLVMKRGAGKSAGGKALPTIDVSYDPNFDFQAEIEPRPQFKEIETGWIDPKTGIWTSVKGKGGFKSSRLGVMHPYASKEEAEEGAEANAQEQGRKSASASFTMPGRPDAVAECKVKPNGFGEDIDSVEWISASVTHDASPDQGWMTTIECDTKGKGDEESE